MKIGKVNIGEKYKPFVIAEMSGNHNKSLKNAIKIVEAAYKAGADAIKLQTYTPETITIDSSKPDFYISDSKSLWKGQNLFNLYKKAYTPWEWHTTIFKKAKELGLICFSSPFDETAVDFLENLKVPAYKIASFEITHIPLIKKIAKTKKPVILSTGMATISEIELAINTLRDNGCKNYILLKCTSTYPSSPKHSNIKTISHMKRLFNCEVGLSDHTLGFGAATASIGQGATVIEKHLTLDRSKPGVDNAFSLEPKEFKILVDEIYNSWLSIGNISYGPLNVEKNSKKFRRSIFFSENLKKNDVISLENIRVVRPGNGMEPKYLELILGRKIKKNVSVGTPVKWSLIK